MTKFDWKEFWRDWLLFVQVFGAAIFILGGLLYWCGGL